MDEVSELDYGSAIANRAGFNEISASEEEAPVYGDILAGNSDTPIYGDVVITQTDYAEVNVPALATEEGYGVPVGMAPAAVTVEAEYGEIDSPVDTEAATNAFSSPPPAHTPGPPAAEASKLATLATAKVTQLQDKGRPLSLHSPSPSEGGSSATPKVQRQGLGVRLNSEL